MKKHLRLASHNIENATGLEVGMGHYKDTVLLTIAGTIGRMTVDATDLLAAVNAVREGWEKLESKGTIKLIERRDVERHNVERRDVEQPDDERCEVEWRSPEEVKATRQPRQNRVHSARPVSAPADAVEPRDEQEQPPIASPATVVQKDVTTASKSVAWTARDDMAITILSPEMAASKLRRPLETILARRRDLGLKTSGLVRKTRRKSFANRSG